MAAYAALVSVMHIIEQIDKKWVESLTKNITFLQEFLESYAPTGKNGGDGLENRILDAANAVEDVIESHIVDRILARSTSEFNRVEFLGDYSLLEENEGDDLESRFTDAAEDVIEFTSQGDQVEFGQLLEKVIENMDLIKNEAMETKEKMRVHHPMERKSPSFSDVKKQHITMVGFDDALLELLDKLTRGGLHRQIIPIVGMGGMGKTTLARNVYEHPFIKEKFDILAWATISQEYDVREILTKILSQANRDNEDSRETNEKEIGEKLYKYLFGRKYLIVMDDMWSIEAWDNIKFFFPDNNNGSRIVVTTRLSNLARWLSNSYALRMRFLYMDESWDLFFKIVFPRGDAYPREMVEIGKKIVRNCRGLPLSIVVVGGFLAKSEYTREHWEHIEENLNSVVNYDNDEHCFKILQLSYKQLPVHLKSCFLYMGVIKEDNEIRISKLIKIWIAEGFLKPISGKDLEEVAEEYLNDLVDRNLILIVKSRGKYVKIHDLLRDLCLRQAEAERFYNVVTQHSVTIPHNQRRFIVSDATLDDEVHVALLDMPLARSVIWYDWESYPSVCHRLLRIYGPNDEAIIIEDDYYFQANKFQLVNLRYLGARCVPWDSRFATSLHLLWSLQTLIIQCGYRIGFTAPIEIWQMPQVRHVEVEDYLELPNPPICDGQDNVVLESLQTLKLKGFKCGEEVIRRIPNIKKLSLQYVGDEFEESSLDNLDRLHKLKSLLLTSYPYPKPDGTSFLHKLSFPRSLKKLVLYGSHVYWEDMLEKIGSLSLLQNLKLGGGFFTTHTWETVEGQFRSLKFLKIDYCGGLEYWNSECSHFPRLEHLFLCGLNSLNEIPLGIGEIPTLQSIELIHCSKSAIISCRKIKEVHEELYGEEEEVALSVGS